MNGCLCDYFSNLDGWILVFLSTSYNYDLFHHSNRLIFHNAFVFLQHRIYVQLHMQPKQSLYSCIMYVCYLVATHIDYLIIHTYIYVYTYLFNYYAPTYLCTIFYLPTMYLCTYHLHTYYIFTYLLYSYLLSTYALCTYLLCTYLPI